MNRLLLALLAVLAGLVTQVSPAQARLCGARDTEIGALEAGAGSAHSVSCQAAVAAAPVATHKRREVDASPVRPAHPRVITPSVLFSADRAYE